MRHTNISAHKQRFEELCPANNLFRFCYFAFEMCPIKFLGYITEPPTGIYSERHFLIHIILLAAKGLKEFDQIYLKRVLLVHALRPIPLLTSAAVASQARDAKACKATGGLILEFFLCAD